MRCVRCHGLCVPDQALSNEGQLLYARCVNCGACHDYALAEVRLSERSDFESARMHQRRAHHKRPAAARPR
jgi:hypothetical protein